MDDVEELEKQDLEKYIDALETTVNNLDKALAELRREKETLFDEHVNALYKIYNIGG